MKSRTWLSKFTFTFHFHALENEMTTHSSILAWRIPGTEEPSGLPSMGSHRVGHNWGDLAAAAAATTESPHSNEVRSWHPAYHFMANRWINSGKGGRIYLFFLVSKIPADGDYSQEIKRHLLLERKVMTNLLLLLSRFSHIRLCATP